MALNQLKNGKAPSVRNVSPELLRYGEGATASSALQPSFILILFQMTGGEE